ncbi:hypothetical protein MOD25_05950 [Bacillus haynesii]|uniref:hypothetical protein n=1 Tax=Bacillus haynesii TaxID=1925021 RepID=UPI002283267D|nr:hypothetical protein [Bacillus haynesii]MCY8549446.1 hypothetical protein [Bacillus haynesii]
MKLTKLLPTVLLTFLVGCGQTVVSEAPTNGENRFNGINANRITIITDSKTGCKYIYVEDGQGNYKTTAMSPLYSSFDGVDCEK